MSCLTYVSTLLSLRRLVKHFRWRSGPTLRTFTINRDRSASHNSIQLWPDSFERGQPKGQALISSLYLTRTCVAPCKLLLRIPWQHPTAALLQRVPRSSHGCICTLWRMSKSYGACKHMITHLLYILMIDETYRAQNEQQRPLQDLSTLPKLLSVKHSLPRRVPTSQAGHYS